MRKFNGNRRTRTTPGALDASVTLKIKKRKKNGCYDYKTIFSYGFNNEQCD